MAGRVAGAVALLLVLGSAGDLLGQPRATDDLIRSYQARVARRPGDLRSYARLGQAYILKARETGDPQYFDLADKALARCLELGPDPATATRATSDLAIVQMARHQFREALATAQKALTFGSGELSPYGPIGDAHIELGEDDQAEAAYEKMRGLQGPLYPHSRLSMLRLQKGDAAGAIVEMRRAVEAAVEGTQPKEHIAWAQYKLGATLFQTGALEAAGQAHQDALATYPGYHRALAGLAQVRAAQGRYPEAIELYRKAVGTIPLPDYVASLGDVYTRIGHADEARKQYALVEYIGRLNALNKVLYNRELALFYLDHDMKLGEALDLARRELEVRGDIYTHDVLAWALYKNGRAGDALAPMKEALRLGTPDPRLFFHAGMIDRAAGEPERGRELLQRALALNPQFHVLHAEVAERALKEIGPPTGQP
jgi:tetratricopeptide (TPR) repeat protein